MMDECFWINAPQWCGWQYWKRKKEERVDIGLLSIDSAMKQLRKPEANSKIWTIKPLCLCLSVSLLCLSVSVCLSVSPSLSLSLSHHYLAIANTWAGRQFEHYSSVIFGDNIKRTLPKAGDWGLCCCVCVDFFLSPRLTLTWHASKCKVHKLLQR